jgi:carbonic anhydrase
MTRRSALFSMTACACCLPGAFGARAAEKSAGAHPHWGYAGAESPEHWGQLSADFKTCQIGMEQTPIDLDNGVRAQFDKPLSLDYKPVAGKIINNGHTIQVNLEKGCSCMIEGTSYDLLQFHFHHPSEHLVSGKPWQMEVHLVHKAPDGGIAAIGVFMREGTENSLLAPVFDGMPLAAGGEKALPAALDASGLFPSKRGYYRYMGSLTTPPCSEGLTWTVFKEPIEVSGDQIRKFASLFPNNARPVQNRNRRFLLEDGM